MLGLEIDEPAQVIGGGANWEMVLEVTTPHGLAPVLGSLSAAAALARAQASVTRQARLDRPATQPMPQYACMVPAGANTP